MKQIQKPKRHRGPADGRQESLAADPRDPNIAHAHRTARRGSPPGAGRARSASRNRAAPTLMVWRPGGARA
ncbi:MAG TPA: hypothetical protein VGF32_30260 [Streptosporangiaceae bacterium]|jgi:hypothetical protein